MSWRPYNLYLRKNSARFEEKPGIIHQIIITENFSDKRHTLQVSINSFDKCILLLEATRNINSQ